jgi:hypothetical protein
VNDDTGDGGADWDAKADTFKRDKRSQQQASIASQRLWIGPACAC